MKKLFLLFGFGLFLFIHGVNAQQVISSAGVSGSNANGSISSTVGELFIDTKTAGGTTITQGFHQTKLTVTDIKELQNLGFVINISPNPTSDNVTIIIDNIITKNFIYVLFDTYGKVIKSGNILNGKAEISFISLIAGTYIIKISQGSKEIKTSKIIKQ